jgi:hypothetical protein
MTVESNLHTAAKPLEQSETHLLIGSDKVAGTAVYSSDGQKMGRIERVMIGKHTGKVDYPVMSLGGFLGIGEDYYPLPWQLLTYNPELGGYQVAIGEDQLRRAPKYSDEAGWEWTRDRARAIDDYWGPTIPAA